MSWVMAAGAAITVVGNAVGSSSGRRAQQGQARLRETMGRENLNVSNAYSNEQLMRAEQIRADYAGGQRGATANNGFATATVDPVTGQMTSALNAPWAGARDTLMGQAQQAGAQGTSMFARGNAAYDRGDAFYAQAGSADPQAFARDRYNSAQALLAPGDAQRQQGLMQDLYNKGGFGLSLNQAQAPSVDANGQIVPGSGTAAMNPYVNSFLNTTNARNAQMSYGSLREGQDYLDSILRRGNDAYGIGNGLVSGGGNMFGVSAGQYGQAGNIEGQNQNAMNQAFNYGNTLTARDDAERNMYWKQIIAARDANAQGQIDFNNMIAGGNGGAGAANRSQMFSGIGNQLGSAVGGMNFSGMFGGGAMPSGGAAGGGMPAGSAYNTNMYPGYPGGDMN